MHSSTDEHGPIFIGGVERSGTSLLYALLGSHPNIAMTRRTNLWPYFYERYGDLSQPENLDRCLAAMKHYNRVMVLKPDFDSLRSDFLAGERSYARLFSLLWGQVAARAGKPRWGDKSLNTERYADLIFGIYPNAKILHIIRDPRDRFASALKRWKVIRGGVGSGTAMWLGSVHLAKRNMRKYPGRYRAVRYESLASQPEETMAEVCAFLNEPYTPDMLSMKSAETFRDEGGNSAFEQHAPGTISTRSIGRYQKFLSPEMIAFIQTFAGPEMREYNYTFDRIQLPKQKWLRFYLADLPVNLARMLMWNGREAYLDRIGREIPSSRILSDTNGAQA